ncbi:sulfatase-like hydrolase/transferase [Bifidobacterium ruminantium]|nr:sulfatase-like hydrolase/transferase [Bifidobacterium ruminantium]
MLINPRLHKGLFAVKEATMPYIQSAVHAFEPSYTKHPKQSFTGGIYQPLADESMTDTPSYFKARHRAELYTRKTTLHTKPARRSIYIPTTEASHATCDTNILAIADEQHASSFAAEAQVNVNHALQAMPRTLQTVRTALTTAGHSLKRIGQTIASAAHATARVTRTAATTVRNAWRTFTSFKAVQLIIKFFRGAHALWKKRHRFSFSFYAIILITLTTFETLFIQWGMYSEPEYKKGEDVSEAVKQASSIVGQLSHFISQIWSDKNYIFLLNLIILAVVYLTLIFIINRFWIATAIFGTVMTVYAVANHIKIESRNEPVLPADLNFITGGNTGQLASFIPQSSQGLVNTAVSGVIWLVVICIIMQFIDGRNAVIYCSWRHPFTGIKNLAGTLTRIVAACCSFALCFSFVWGFGNEGYWSTDFAKNLGDSPQIWNGLADSTNNGPVVNFLRLAHTKTMDKPNGYSQEAMEKISRKYTEQAKQLNQTRTENMTDNTVIMMLSETFSDPTRVPGVSFSEDPIPNIRQIKTQTTSGLMLSPGYGGGTANIEYQALTGLSIANYDSTLSIAYQQLVPSLKWTPTLNQAWNTANGKNASIALHPFKRNMYFRDSNYIKFGFSKFYALDGKPKIKNTSIIDHGWLASDESFYKDILQEISSNNENKFYQTITIQNHMPYEDFYDNNQFKDEDTSTGLDAGEKQSIDVFTKGLNYTDQATRDFLNELDNIDRPITILFYGDHLPGIYSTAYSDKKNILGLHETDYFIWSNQASKSAGTKLNAASSDYTSSNYFSAQLAEHLNAKVSPFIAFLTEMHQAIPAMSVPDSSGNSSSPTYLDAQGNLIKEKNLSKQAKQLLHDYRLIQYDMSVGKNYLKDTSFVDLPK